MLNKNVISPKKKKRYIPLVKYRKYTLLRHAFRYSNTRRCLQSNIFKLCLLFTIKHFQTLSNMARLVHGKSN